MRKYALLEFFKCLSLRKASITKGPVRLYEHTKSYLYRNVIYCNEITKDVPYQHVTKFFHFLKPENTLVFLKVVYSLLDRPSHCIICISGHLYEIEGILKLGLLLPCFKRICLGKCGWV